MAKHYGSVTFRSIVISEGDKRTVGLTTGTPLLKGFKEKKTVTGTVYIGNDNIPSQIFLSTRDEVEVKAPAPAPALEAPMPNFLTTDHKDILHRSRVIVERSKEILHRSQVIVERSKEYWMGIEIEPRLFN